MVIYIQKTIFLNKNGDVYSNVDADSFDSNVFLLI